MSIITFSFSEDPTTSLTGEAYSCGMDVPADGMVNKYPNNYQCSCSYCSETCEAPAVNADIAVFAGFNFKTVGWSYFALILFTIIFQVASHYWCRRKPPTLISQTASTAAATRDNSSQLVAPYGGRLNNTVETSMTSNRDSALLRGVEIRN